MNKIFSALSLMMLFSVAVPQISFADHGSDEVSASSHWGRKLRRWFGGGNRGRAGYCQSNYDCRRGQYCNMRRGNGWYGVCVENYRGGRRDGWNGGGHNGGRRDGWNGGGHHGGRRGDGRR